jgi:hypothetical protein
LTATARGDSEGKNMSSMPMLSAAQWRRIENILPPNRRDSAVIAALLYREFSGQSLRRTGEAYGLSRVRLHEWHGALKADSCLAKVMMAQKNPPATCSPRRGPALVPPQQGAGGRSHGDQARRISTGAVHENEEVYHVVV